jgi:hypothetical protein
MVSKLIKSKDVYDEVQDYSNLHNKRSSFMGEQDETNYLMTNYINNQDMEIMNTPFQPKIPMMSNEIEYMEDLDNRPVDSHFNSEKGYKFDVTVPKGERYVSGSNRLGDIDVLPHPLLTLIRYKSNSQGRR